MKSTTVTGAAFLLTILSANVAAQTLSPERVRNIEKAGAEMGAIQKKSGANGTLAAIQDCYKRELAQATALTPQLEACMAEDIIASYVTAEVYSRFPTAGRDPDAVIDAMTDRVVAVIRRFHMPPDDAHAFIDIAKTRGIQAFARGAVSGSISERKK
jgi:hypothetical protein